MVQGGATGQGLMPGSCMAMGVGVHESVSAGELTGGAAAAAGVGHRHGVDAEQGRARARNREADSPLQLGGYMVHGAGPAAERLPGPPSPSLTAQRAASGAGVMPPFRSESTLSGVSAQSTLGTAESLPESWILGMANSMDDTAAASSHGLGGRTGSCGLAAPPLASLVEEAGEGEGAAGQAGVVVSPEASEGNGGARPGPAVPAATAADAPAAEQGAAAQAATQHAQDAAAPSTSRSDPTPAQPEEPASDRNPYPAAHAHVHHSRSDTAIPRAYSMGPAASPTLPPHLLAAAAACAAAMVDRHGVSVGPNTGGGGSAAAVSPGSGGKPPYSRIHSTGPVVQHSVSSGLGLHGSNLGPHSHLPHPHPHPLTHMHGHAHPHPNLASTAGHVASAGSSLHGGLGSGHAGDDLSWHAGGLKHLSKLQDDIQSLQVGVWPHLKVLPAAVKGLRVYFEGATVLHHPFLYGQPVVVLFFGCGWLRVAGYIPVRHDGLP